MIKTNEKHGVVALWNGLYYGIVQEDVHGKLFGFGPIEKAIIGNEYVKNPTDLTYSGSKDIRFLEKAKLVKIKITTTFETEE